MMIGWLHEAIKDSVLGDVWNLVVCYQKIVICMEDVGTMRSLGIIYLSQSGFRNDNAYNRFVQVNSSSEDCQFRLIPKKKDYLFGCR